MTLRRGGSGETTADYCRRGPGGSNWQTVSYPRERGVTPPATEA